MSLCLGGRGLLGLRLPWPPLHPACCIPLCPAAPNQPLCVLHPTLPTEGTTASCLSPSSCTACCFALIAHECHPPCHRSDGELLVTLISRHLVRLLKTAPSLQVRPACGGRWNYLPCHSFCLRTCDAPDYWLHQEQACAFSAAAFPQSVNPFHCTPVFFNRSWTPPRSRSRSCSSTTAGQRAWRRCSSSRGPAAHLQGRPRAGERPWDSGSPHLRQWKATCCSERWRQRCR